MAVTTLKRNSVNFILIKSTDPTTGKQTTVSVALQDAAPDADADAILAIQTAAAACFAYPVKHTERSSTEILTSD
ncbi:hypothetical protein IJI69_02085 [Candidatus Saccharibacteria bacterium]|nr:hypothetical protein [Candidatus Saccharibacteria bacterium]